MSPRKPSDRPIAARAEEGEVLIDGPDGVVASFTPDAARQSAKRLKIAADQAEAQLRAKS
ncbi:hypothetical protein [Stakelama saccharophila]|uniref:Uncharacterized protein n=1 Tax=Stakelama saccharophila TaxID=3075605 RepID=A0ABZ0B9E1_9SPHN|nr:hypothetical protein [Stakelama sp. W311]WNO53246.1 hypothetical protein RPR59_12450 [Stakelama sp. W311]